MDSGETTLDQAQLIRDSEWLRGYLEEHTGEDRYFDIILGREGASEHPLHATTVFEADRLQMFREIVEYLTELCGDARPAAEWLFRNEHFEKTGKDSPFQYLEHGQFDALWLLNTCLEMSMGDRRKYPENKGEFTNPLEALLPTHGGREHHRAI